MDFRRKLSTLKHPIHEEDFKVQKMDLTEAGSSVLEESKPKSPYT